MLHKKTDRNSKASKVPEIAVPQTFDNTFQYFKKYIGPTKIRLKKSESPKLILNQINLKIFIPYFIIVFDIRFTEKMLLISNIKVASNKK